MVFKVEVSKKTLDRLPSVAESRETYFNEMGFTAVEKSTKVLNGSVADVLYADDLREDPDHKLFLKDTAYDDQFSGKNKKILYFKNGLHFDASLDLSITQMIGISNAGIIVNGELTVDGFLEAEANMTVFGGVRAANIYNQYAFVVIRGNLWLKQSIVGVATAGSLSVKGDVHGEAWITYDHEMYAEGSYNIRTLDAFMDFGKDNVPDWLDHGLFNFEEVDGELIVRFNEDAAIRYMKGGKSFLK